VIVGDSEGLALPDDPAIRTLAAPHPEAGVHSGLEALLASGLDSGYLVLTAHQPFLTENLLRDLTGGAPSVPHFFVVPRGASFHPFPGYYPAAQLELLRTLSGRGEYCLRDFSRQSSPLWLPLAESEQRRLLPVNVPAQLDRLKSLSGQN
jgi:molybdopterin-guanine dinucleotide biosynthesis protein A